MNKSLLGDLRRAVPNERVPGIGLAGAAVPGEKCVVTSLSKMDEILSVVVDNRLARVESEVLNLGLSRHVNRHGPSAPCSRRAHDGVGSGTHRSGPQLVEFEGAGES